MPFTPFHLGLGLFIGLILYSYLDLITVLIGSMILDVWPFLVLYLNLKFPLHGVSHSFLVAFLVSILLAVLVFYINKFFNKEKTFRVIFLGFLVGTFLHILLDSPLYTDILPFWPSHFNPFYGLYTYSFSIIISIVLFILALGILFFKFFNRKHY